MNNRWQDWVNALLGFLLALSPSQMGFSLNHYATGNAYGIGTLLVFFNVFAACRNVDDGQEIVNILTGIWLILSPYALSFETEIIPSMSMEYIGAAIIFFAVWQIVETIRIREN